MASRPLVQVYGADGKSVGQVAQPSVFLTPIRHDIVQHVQSNIRKNHRQAYAVSKTTGMQSSAMSWGTGRAVARIPRVPGGGTHRAGQGAFGNMCRGGRMYAPTRTWRRWHRKINVNQKRYAIAAALAASAVPALVMARGHRISEVAEIPLVVSSEVIEPVQKTKAASALLHVLKAYADVERVKNSVRKNTGAAKWRNRPKTKRVGPLIIHGNRGNTAFRAFRNLSGVEVTGVWDLNLLRLAPGGHVGRFIIWTKSAFDQLDAIWGTDTKKSEAKVNYWLPRPILSNPDLGRIINSDQVAAIVRPKHHKPEARRPRPNYMKNSRAMARINPYFLVQRKNLARRSFAAKTAKANKKPATAEERKKIRAGIAAKGKSFSSFRKLVHF